MCKVNLGYVISATGRCYLIILLELVDLFLVFFQKRYISRDKLGRIEVKINKLPNNAVT
jgi:hypothetical protein